MSNPTIYRILHVARGQGAKPKPRTPEQKARLRRIARRDQQSTVVQLSDYLPRPLSSAWEDGRLGKQRWWGNLLRHAEELVDSPTPPPFRVTFTMAMVLAWALIDLYEDRGLPVEFPPNDPVAQALGVGRAA